VDTATPISHARNAPDVPIADDRVLARTKTALRDPEGGS
jgi:hypothetical protein